MILAYLIVTVALYGFGGFYWVSRPPCGFTAACAVICWLLAGFGTLAIRAVLQ